MIIRSILARIHYFETLGAILLFSQTEKIVIMLFLTHEIFPSSTMGREKIIINENKNNYRRVLLC